jgi:hypothetical protein
VTPAQLHEHLKGRLEPDVLLVTDAHAAYRAFARGAGISHEAVNLKAGTRVRGAAAVTNIHAPGYGRPSTPLPILPRSRYNACFGRL